MKFTYQNQDGSASQNLMTPGLVFNLVHIHDKLNACYIALSNLVSTPTI